MIKRILLAGLVLLVGLSQHAKGAIVFTNPITDVNPSAANPYTTGQSFDPNITVGGILRGPGLTASSAANRFSATAFTTAATLDPTDYFSFTLTPNAGNTLSFTNFVYTSQASGTGPTTLAFRSSVDGFTTNVGSPAVLGTTISLASPTFQNRTTSTEFRLYGFGGSAAGGTFSVNDFTFNGTVTAVPEPSSMAMLGLVGLGGVIYRRRKARA